MRTLRITPLRAALAVLVLALAAGLWTVSASAIFLLGTHLWGAWAWPGRAWAWWAYRPYGAGNPAVALWLHRSGLGAAAVTAAGFGAVIYRLQTMPKVRASTGEPRQIERGNSDNHGHADWLSMPALCRMFPGPDPVHGGVVVGEAYRVDQDTVADVPFDPADRKTWGQGGKAPLLIDPCRDGSTHSLLFAGSGGFKTTTAATTLLHWLGSAVVLDPSCEMGPMLKAARERRGHTAIMLSPDTAEDVGVNVLDWIDTSKPLADSHVMSVVDWICGDAKQGGNDEAAFFVSWGKKLVACLLAHLLWDDTIPDAERTLRRLRQGIVMPEKDLKAALRYIYANSKSRLARDVAGSLMDMAADETFSGIYANASDATFWLSIKAYADLVSGSTFKTEDLARGHLTVFIQIPLEALIVTPGVGRTITGALLNAVYKADGRIAGRVLFLLDEAARLGRMAVLQQARDAGRKYGITLQLLYQSVGQLEDIWGRHEKRAWYDSVSWRGYAAVRDYETAKELSEIFGSFAVIAYSEGDNSGRQTGMNLTQIGNRSRGQNTSRHEIKRSLISSAELLQDARTDELFIIARGKPIRCGRAIFFRRADAKLAIEASRFVAERGPRVTARE